MKCADSPIVPGEKLAGEVNAESGREVMIGGRPAREDPGSGETVKVGMGPSDMGTNGASTTGTGATTALTMRLITAPSSTANSRRSLPSPIAFPLRIHRCASGAGAVGSLLASRALRVEMVDVEGAERVKRSGGFADLIVREMVSARSLSVLYR